MAEGIVADIAASFQKPPPPSILPSMAIGGRGGTGGASRRRRERGLALVMVLWAAVLIGLMAGGVARLGRDDVMLARNMAEAARAELAADGGVEVALHALLLGDAGAATLDGAVAAWTLAGSDIRVAVTDETGRIDINAASPDLLAALFAAAGASGAEAAELAAAVSAFRGDDVLRGTPAGDGVPPPPFVLAEELMRVPGMTRPLFDRVAPAITVYTGAFRPRPDSAPALVRAALEGRVLAEGEAALPATGADMAAARPPGLLRVHAEARTASGAVFAREAVVDLRERGAGRPYRVRLWQRGERRLFPGE